MFRVPPQSPRVPRLPRDSSGSRPPWPWSRRGLGLCPSPRRRPWETWGKPWKKAGKTAEKTQERLQKTLENMGKFKQLRKKRRKQQLVKLGFLDGKLRIHKHLLKLLGHFLMAKLVNITIPC